MFILIYRPHGKMHIDTKYYVFTSFDAAYDKLCSLPALGWHSTSADDDTNELGIKYIVESEAV